MTSVVDSSIGILMTKKRDLLNEIRREARNSGVAFRLMRFGNSHDIWIIGNSRIPIPRHTEINVKTAREIRKECEKELGKEWWRK